MIKNKLFYPAFAFIALIIVILFINPYLMITPGKLTAGHESIQKDCSGCHTYFKGAEFDKCTACHKQSEIGIKLTSGKANTTYTESKIIFHAQLKNNDCINCHTEHMGNNNLKSKFNHSYLDENTQAKCSSCHKKPNDEMHRNFEQTCSECHSADIWKPASFDHNKYFIFDKDHPSDCNNCHKESNNFKYTCYGCHEHTEAKIRSEHLEEGINNYQNCVECHKSGNKEDAEKKFKNEGEGKGEEGEDD